MLATGWKITPLFVGFCMVLICKAGDSSPSETYDLSKLLLRATSYFLYEGTFTEEYKYLPEKTYYLIMRKEWFNK
uniref:Putative secreted protein n=1 Tax=Ixodes ricinus TaxID=34613 RepID=V5ID02_IXORI